jgi:hypothetical protein
MLVQNCPENQIPYNSKRTVKIIIKMGGFKIAQLARQVITHFATGIQSPKEQSFVSSIPHPDRFSGALRTLSLVYWGSSLWMKWPKIESNRPRQLLSR